MTSFSRRSILIKGSAGLSLALLASVSSPSQLWAGETPLAASYRVALGGYDPVSYFTDHQPEKGLPDFSATFDQATYYFKSSEHRDMFAADPDRYAPQYAGYCAGGISTGQKFEGDPHAWVISDGKLFVFWSKDEIPKFSSQASLVISEADAQWRSKFQGH